MTEHDRNVRTLIICFALAMLALVPLRIMGEGKSLVASQSQVLGEMTERTKEVVLPNAETPETEILKADYIGR